MSAPQAAAITACTACAAVGGAAAGGAFSSGTTTEDHVHNETPEVSTEDNSQNTAKTPQIQEPTWKSLIVEIESSNQTYDSKIGKEYGHWLVGVSDKNKKTNEAWWNKTYKLFESDHVASNKREFSETFKTKDKVTLGFHSSTATALNKVCDTIYKDDKNKLGKDSDKKKLRDDLWRYCSDFGVAPLTIEDNSPTENTTAGTIGESKKAELLSTEATNNEKFWVQKDKEFAAIKAQVTEPFFSTKKDTAKIKEICKEAYTKQKTSSTATDPKEDAVVKYCSLKEIKAVA